MEYITKKWAEQNAKQEGEKNLKTRRIIKYCFVKKKKNFNDVLTNVTRICIFERRSFLQWPHALEVLWALQLRALCARCDATASAAISWGHCAWSPRGARLGHWAGKGSSLGFASLSQWIFPGAQQAESYSTCQWVVTAHTGRWFLTYIQILGVFPLSHHHRLTTGVSMQSLGHCLQSRKGPFAAEAPSLVSWQSTQLPKGALEVLAVADSSTSRLQGWTIYLCFLLPSTQMHSVILLSLIIPFLIPSCQLNQPNSTRGWYFLFHNCLTVFLSMSSWQFFALQISERKVAHFTGNCNCFPGGFVSSAYRKAETKQADLSWQDEVMEEQAIHFMDSSLRTINAFWLCLSHCQQSAFCSSWCC